jgi:hypothetical protein
LFIFLNIFSIQEMPLVVFQFQNSVGVNQEFVQRLFLRTVPPRGARFILKQVSASTDQPLLTAFQYIRVAIPEIMSDNDRVLFQTYTINNVGQAVPDDADDALRYYLTDSSPTPLGVNVFPNLSLGRHSLNSPFLTLTLSGRNAGGATTALTAYTVVIEWDTE